MNYSPTATEDIAIRKADFELDLDQAYSGDILLKNALCRSKYKWDFSKHTGAACLISVNDLGVNMKLHPNGIQGMWDFTSNIQPTQYLIEKQSIVIYRVALNIDLFTGEKSAAILLGQHGTSIISTTNFDVHSSALTT